MVINFLKYIKIIIYLKFNQKQEMELLWESGDQELGQLRYFDLLH